MPFQGWNFIRNQNFTRDRNAGPPDHFISAEKMDDELANIADGLTTTRVAAATADEKAGLASERAVQAESNIRGGVDEERNTLKKLFDWVTGGFLKLAGGALTGALSVANSITIVNDGTVSLIFHRPGVKTSRWSLGANGDLVLADNNSGASLFRILAGGGINTERGKVLAGDVRAARVNGTGVIFLNDADTRYLYWTGATYVLATDTGEKSIWHEGNFDPASRVTGDGIGVAGFAGDNPDLPYFRRRSDNGLYYLQRRLGYTPVVDTTGGRLALHFDGARNYVRVDQTFFAIPFKTEVDAKMPLPEGSNNPSLTNYPIGTVVTALYGPGGLSIRQYISMGISGATGYFNVNGPTPLAGTWVVLGITGFLSSNNANPLYLCQRIA
ncbi:hypothetical protein [Aureimonas mangrovi]|uniref:hypothetical protein n=1 Tax=Aureimonas mangrovi TaxID=2758041 RepID=UPI00163D4F8D|nr:hypothetical protein [Aureimonas mangrovi]